MTKVLLTGATGMLGSRVAKALLGKKISVRATVLRDAGPGLPSGPGLEIVEADITRPETLERAFEGVDAVIHCAGLVDGSDSKEFFRVNAEGTKNLVRAAEKAGIKKLVHVSTADVAFRRGAYSLSKLEGEQAVKASKLKWVVVRPTAIYDERKSKISKVLLMARSWPVVPVLGSGRQKLQPVWIGDVADFLIKALESKKSTGKVYTLASESPVSMNAILDIAARALHKPIIKLHIPMPVLFAAACINEKVSKRPFLNRDQLALLSEDKAADISLARKELGFRPLKIEKGIARVLG